MEADKKQLKDQIAALEKRVKELEGGNSDRKIAEESLRREKEFNQAIFDTAQTIILVLDTEGRITSFNPYMEKISGYGIDEVRGKDWFDVFIPERDREHIRELFKTAEGGDQTKGNTNPIVTKDGCERLIEWFDKTLKGADSRVIGLVAIGQDVTERKEAEERIKIFSDAVASAFDCVFLTDTEGNITYANAAACTIFGYTLEEFLEMNTVDLDVDPGAVKKVMRELAAEGKWSGEVTNIKKNKEKFVSFLSVYTIKDEKGGSKGTMGILRDITERKKLEAEERKHIRELEVFYDAAMDREDRILELKDEINKLKKKLEGKN